MAGKRKSHPAAFKAPVALAAVKGDKTVNELASQYAVHPTLIHEWRRRRLAGAAGLFEHGAKPAAEAEDRSPELYEQIGRLKVELDWVKKKLPPSAAESRPLVEPGHASISVRRQCELLGLSRASYYLKPAGESAENLALTRAIDEPYTACPFYGSRRITARLARGGREVNRKRVQRLLRLMGPEAIHPKPRRSAGRGHEIYPYLLRDVAIERVGQVWSADITYLPLTGGFMYPAATVDWYSRYVVAWRLSNTLDGAFCREMLDEALEAGTPEVFNTDRGVRFTAGAWVGRVGAAGVRVGMDGRGRCLDNAFVERLWRTVRYEDVFLRGYGSVPERERGLRAYFAFYNHERLHQSLGYRTPGEVYRAGRSEEPARK